MDSEDAPHERREVSLTLRCGDITQDFELGSVAEGDSVQTTVLALASSLLKGTYTLEAASSRAERRSFGSRRSSNEDIGGRAH